MSRLPSEAVTLDEVRRSLQRIDRRGVPKRTVRTEAPFTPLPSDDIIDDHDYASIWLDAQLREAYICLDPTKDQAQWVKFVTSTSFATLAEQDDHVPLAASNVEVVV